MNTETKFKIGSVWRTRGGQKATVVWIKRDGTLVVVIHRPLHDVVVLHSKDGSEWNYESAGDLITPWVDRPELPPGVAWPKWAKAFSQSSTGNWHWWDETPLQVSNVWHSVNGTYCIPMHPTERPNWTGDWRESLVVREGGE